MIHLISSKVACDRRKIGGSQELIFQGSFLALGSQNADEAGYWWLAVLYKQLVRLFYGLVCYMNLDKIKNSTKIHLHYINIYRLIFGFCFLNRSVSRFLLPSSGIYFFATHLSSQHWIPRSLLFKSSPDLSLLMFFKDQPKPASSAVCLLVYKPRWLD